VQAEPPLEFGEFEGEKCHMRLSARLVKGMGKALFPILDKKGMRHVPGSVKRRIEPATYFRDNYLDLLGPTLETLRSIRALMNFDFSAHQASLCPPRRPAAARGVAVPAAAVAAVAEAAAEAAAAAAAVVVVVVVVTVVAVLVAVVVMVAAAVAAAAAAAVLPRPLAGLQGVEAVVAAAAAR